VAADGGANRLAAAAPELLPDVVVVLSSIMQVGNLVNLSIHLADF
jgi:hypothetical protein